MAYLLDTNVLSEAARAEPDAERWGRLSAEGQRAGRPLQLVDGLLLATAARHGLTLVTRNVTDCEDGVA